MKKVHILIIGILVILLIFSQNSESNAQQDITITVEEGSFILKNLSLASEKYLGPKLKGDVLNNTSKDWNQVTFEVDLYDSTGNKLKEYIEDSFSFTLYGLKRG